MFLSSVSGRNNPVSAFNLLPFLANASTATVASNAASSKGDGFKFDDYPFTKEGYKKFQTDFPKIISDLGGKPYPLPDSWSVVYNRCLWQAGLLQKQWELDKKWYGKGDRTISDAEKKEFLDGAEKLINDADLAVKFQDVKDELEKPQYGAGNDTPLTAIKALATLLLQQ